MKHLPLALAVLAFAQAVTAQTPNWIKNPATGHYYAVTSKAASWSNAQKEAKAFGANLATVRTKAENDWLVKTFTVAGGFAWIGLNDVVKEGAFVWATGQPLGPYANWAPNQPNNGGGNVEEDYVVLHTNAGDWQDYGIAAVFIGIMERIDPEFSTFGAGCASTSALPTISSTSTPSLGRSFTLNIKGFLPKPQLGQLIVGASNTHWGIIPLPVSLVFLGAGNCNLHVSMDTPLPIITDSQGTFSTTLKVPALPTFLGSTVYGQAWAPDPKSNPVGIATTNAFKVRIGR